MYKHIGVFAFVALVAGKDLTVGPNGGNKIFDQKLEASPAIWRQVKNVTVNATDGDVISHVVITDLRPEKDGEAEIVEGGEGHKNVTIELKSPAVFRGFEFNIEIYVAPENQHAVPTTQPKLNETPKPEQKVPITVADDDSNDSLRKTRKTDEDKDVTSKVSVGSDGTIVSVTPVSHQSTPVNHQSTPVSHQSTPVNHQSTPVSHQSTPVSHQSTPVNHQSTPVSYQSTPVNHQSTPVSYQSGTTSHVTTPIPSTTQVNKENDGVKINIPVNIGKDTDVPRSNEPKEKESDIVDPLAVKNQPTHMSDNESKTTEKVTLPVFGLKDQSRSVRHTEDATAEAEVTISTTTGYESTTETADPEDAPIIPHIYWNVQSDDTIKPIGNQGLNPPKTIGSDNVAASQPGQRAPIPYTH